MRGGYRLSAQAAAREARWDAERAMPIERKAIVSGWTDGPVATANRDDFSTNRVTLAQFADALAGGEGNVQGLAAAGACVSFWAGNIAGLPLHVLRDAGGVDVPYPEHPLYWLLHDSPNYDQSSFDFWEYMVEALEWRGNAYARMEGAAEGFVTSLVPISPDGMRVTRGPSGDLRYEWNDGTRQVAGSAEILHIRGRGGNALGGASTLGTYRRALAGALATEGAADTIFRNGVRSSGTLSANEKMTREQRDELESKLQEKFVGAQNAGRPMLLDGGLKWDKLTIDPVDAQMIEGRQLGMIVICQIFEVDPHLVGLMFGKPTTRWPASRSKRDAADPPLQRHQLRGRPGLGRHPLAERCDGPRAPEP